MRRYVDLLVLCVMALWVMTDCQKIEDSNSETLSKTYSVSFKKMSENPLKWMPGAELYFADDVSAKPGTQVKVTSGILSKDDAILSANFRTVSKGTDKVYAICAKDAWIRRWKSTFKFIYDGTFVASSAAVGEIDFESSHIELSPTVGVVEFSIKSENVRKVVVKLSSSAIPVKMTYNFKDKQAAVTTTQSSVTVNTVGVGRYYFPVVPGSVLKGATIESFSETGMLLSSVPIENDVPVTTDKILSLGLVDENVDDVLDPEIPQAESAAQAIRNMGVGLNLCATFEELPYQGYKTDRADPLTFESMYNAYTNETTMTTTYSAGFRSLRIPVTWFLHMDNTGSTIDKVWLDRIEEVVKMAIDAGLYCIINMHHDSGQRKDEGAWLFADWGNYSDISADFKNIWRQIAERFKDYDYKLLFESYNELLDENKSWFAPKDENGYKAANALNQDFVNIIRQTGGRNATRNLIVTTYSASTWESALKAFVMPADLLPGHLAVQIHSYLPSKFVTAKDDHREEFYESDIVEIDEMFALVKRYITDKGYPCVLGEYGAYPRRNADNSLNTAYDIHRGRHAAVYARRCLELGIAPMYWYNPMEPYHRKWGVWTFEPVKDSLIKAYNEHITSLQQ